jgi:hypothetical protein
MAAKKWIAGAIKKPGALHRQLGVPEGKKIPAGKLSAAASKGGKLGQRARLAQTLKKMHGGSEMLDRDSSMKCRDMIEGRASNLKHKSAFVDGKNY